MSLSSTGKDGGAGSSSDSESSRDAAEMMREANELMERALKLLDMANEDLTAAKLDDAICSLNLRDTAAIEPASETGGDS